MSQRSGDRAALDRREAPIGVFDSGVGGLTVVSALRAMLPDERIVYLGDTARLPYGSKSAETVRRYSQKNVDFLVARGVKAVVVACNTASATALDTVQAPVPIWGVVEPGAARAAAVSEGRVGVIATESTVRSGAYELHLKRQRAELEVMSVACPLFVPLVEEGWVNDPITESVALRYLEPLIEFELDTLVLGCTHYPLLATLLERVLEQRGARVKVVDSAAAVSEQVRLSLDSLDLCRARPSNEAASSVAGAVHLCFTDGERHFRDLARRILGCDLGFEWVDVS